MNEVNRKRSLIAIVISIVLFAGCESHKESSFNDFPQAPEKVVDTQYFDTLLTDQYRSLENLQDSTVLNWFHKEGEWTANILNQITGRKELESKMAKYVGGGEATYSLMEVTPQGEYFYLKQGVEDEFANLFFRSSIDSEEELLYSPENYKDGSFVINFLKPSWDGQKVVIALSSGGAEISEMIIYDREKATLMPEVITNTWPSDYSGVQWLPNNSGFIYLHYPVIDPQDSDFLKNMASVVYYLGDDPKKLNPIFSKGSQPQLTIEEEDFPMVFIEDPSDDYLLGYVTGGEAYYDAYYASMDDLLAGKTLNWKPIHKKADKVNQLYVVEDDFVFKSAKENSRYNIYRMPVGGSVEEAELLIEPISSESIDQFISMGDEIYFYTSKFGVKAALYRYKDGNVTPIDLPVEAGSLQLSRTHEEADHFFATCIGWTTDFKRFEFQLDEQGFEPAPLDTAIGNDVFEDFVVKEVMVRSHDGEMVPLSIIHQKDLKMDGANPTLFFGYGAYGFSAQPYYLPTWLSWVAEGGVFCIAHVRGGSEKGDSWYQGGKKLTKENTWKDLIACTEYMINENYTSPDYTAAYALSAGGIMVGRAMTDRPDLYAAVISSVGTMNPVRSEKSPNGKNGIKEFGTMEDSLEAKALIKMDSYHHIKEGVEYPATLVTTGLNDPRVLPWQPGKFAAKLQEAQSGAAPILFDVDTASGHGMGDSQQKEIERMAKIFSFAFWQTGHPDFQLQ
ncbi:prolyl oligopeptidase [Marivirga sericea]|uniref:prolyl oligopeptidase n=1 Tax=Marivirga sericea TaxID=1028 RepID=A0A1X7JR38_9BACT|nr:prolyl oligopeptidase family serine peptidase [Marivirga sericea]SMG30713.1 prolyl oligopeptidase [Marivirga sericea]